MLLDTSDAITTGLVAIAANAIGTAILLTALGRRSMVLVRRVWHFWKSPQNAWLMMLGFGPIVMTLTLGIAGYVKVPPEFPDSHRLYSAAAGPHSRWTSAHTKTGVRDHGGRSALHGFHACRLADRSVRLRDIAIGRSRTDQADRPGRGDGCHGVLARGGRGSDSHRGWHRSVLAGIAVL